MDYHHLGSSRWRVPARSVGAGMVGGKGPLFSALGQSDARRLIAICPQAAVTPYHQPQGLARLAPPIV